jgi:NADH:ubiquinone oxidoreductase subunit 3 (subunit A)
MWLSWALRPWKRDDRKVSTYECGEIPIGSAWLQFNFRYYIFALLFVIFDVEIIFLYPWAVKFKDFIKQGFGVIALTEVVIFLLILVVGLIYAWRKGHLKWV